MIKIKLKTLITKNRAFRNEFLFFVLLYLIQPDQVYSNAGCLKMSLFMHNNVALALISKMNFTNTLLPWKFLFFVQLQRTAAHFVPYEI